MIPLSLDLTGELVYVHTSSHFYLKCPINPARLTVGADIGCPMVSRQRCLEFGLQMKVHSNFQDEGQWRDAVTDEVARRMSGGQDQVGKRVRKYVKKKLYQIYYKLYPYIGLSLEYKLLCYFMQQRVCFSTSSTACYVFFKMEGGGRLDCCAPECFGETAEDLREKGYDGGITGRFSG